MAETMQFDLVSPERSLASYAASEIEIPGADGDLTAMPGHAPVITTLRPGVLRAQGDEGEQVYLVTGGFAEVSADGASVLAEMAMSLADAKPEDIDPMIEQARAEVKDTEGAARDLAEKQLADLEALRVAVGG